MNEDHEEGDSTQHVPQVVEQIDPADFRRVRRLCDCRLGKRPWRRSDRPRSKRSPSPGNTAPAARSSLPRSRSLRLPRRREKRRFAASEAGTRRRSAAGRSRSWAIRNIAIGQRSRDSRLAQRRPDAGQQHPIAQNDAEDQLISRKDAHELPHQRQLRQECRQTEAADGKRENGVKMRKEKGEGGKKERSECGGISLFPHFPFSLSQDGSSRIDPLPAIDQPNSRLFSFRFREAGVSS